MRRFVGGYELLDSGVPDPFTIFSWMRQAWITAPRRERSTARRPKTRRLGSAKRSMAAGARWLTSGPDQPFAFLRSLPRAALAGCRQEDARAHRRRGADAARRPAIRPRYGVE